MSHKKRHNRREQVLEHIRGPQAEAFRQFIAGVPLDQILVVPLDIGKDVHWAAFHTADGQLLCEPLKLTTDERGFLQFTGQFDDLLHSGRFRRVLLGHEPSGVYHETWARHLMIRYSQYLQPDATLPCFYRFLNPYQVKLNRQQQLLRFRKTDLLDLGAIGDLLSRGYGYAASLPTDVDLLLREEVHFLKTRSQEQLRLANQITTAFDHLWPGALGNARRFAQAHPDLPPLQPLIKSRPLERTRIRVLIQHCPNPHDILALGEKGIIDLFHAASEPCGPKTAQHILRTAEAALLPPPGVAAAYADIVQRSYGLYLQVQDLIEQAKANLFLLVPQTPARHLLALNGASAYLVGRYLTLCGDPHRFLFADQIWSFAGLDPITEESGNMKRVGHISRKGDPYFRNTLYLLGFQLSRHEAYFGVPFLEAIERGKSEIEATFHAAHKINRVFWHLLINDEPFDPPDIADYPAYQLQFQRRLAAWQAEKKRAQRQPHTRPRRKRPASRHKGG
jgi:transposase